MSVSHMMFSSWRRFRAAFDVSDHQTLLETLCDTYRAEANTVVQCTQQANQVYYPQFRAELLRIAAEVQAHLPWLHEQILALGGHIPLPSPTPTLEGNSWECLRRDVEEARLSCVHLLEWIHRIEREEPQIAAGLQRIRKDKLRHREEFRRLCMKSDPYTLSTTEHPQVGEGRQQQAWLEQRKNEWLDHEQAAWKVGGKQMPWAEWSGEQEFRWAAELSNRGLERERGLVEQRDAEMHKTIP